MPNPPPKTRFELSVELTKALAWPVLVLVLLVVFWIPLHQTASLIPSIVGKSDTITIAGLSLKVSQGLKAKASPDVEKALSNLTKSGIERVLEMGEASYWDQNSIAHGKERNAELLKLGLVTEIPAIEIERINLRDGTKHGYGVKRTELGKQTQAFLQSVVAEFAQELARQSPNAKS